VQGASLEVAPGRYDGTLRIEGRRDLTLRGVVGKAVLTSNTTQGPLLLVRDSSRIALEGLHISAGEGACCGDTLVTIERSKDVAIRDCDIGGGAGIGVAARQSQSVTLERNYLHHGMVWSYQVEALTVTGNLFRLSPSQSLSIDAALGQVRIEQNTFADGAVRAITLTGAELQQPVAEVAVELRHNVFAASWFTDTDPPFGTIVDVSEPTAHRSLAGRVRVEENCFERWRYPVEGAAYYPSAWTAKGNAVLPLVLTADYRVAYPAACAERGAPPLPWLPTSAKVEDARAGERSPVRGLEAALVPEASDDTLVDVLYPIGFSQAGHFAYYAEPADEAVGQYLWAVKVLDLSRNEVVGQRSWDDYGIEGAPPGQTIPVGDIDGVLRHRGPEILALLDRFHIEGGGSYPIRPFPLVSAGERIGARIEERTDREKQRRYHAAVLHSTRRGRQVLGELEEPLEEDSWILGMTVRGYLKSPFSPHIVVLVCVLRRGWEGPPHVVSFDLYGARLDRGWIRSGP
jgi:hypothetical protein